MTAQEELLSHTLAKVRAHIAPSPELLNDIRAAVARAERRRRLLALGVIVAVIIATVIALFIVLTIRAAGNERPNSHSNSSMTAVTTNVDPHEGNLNGEHRHA